MGGMLGKSTSDSYELLESLDRSIQEEQQKKRQLQNSKRPVLIYSMCIMLVLGAILFCYYFGSLTEGNTMLYATIGFLLTLILLKICVSATCQSMIEEHDKKILDLRYKKARKLQHVMETQPYNEATNLLRHFAPDSHVIQLPNAN